MIKVNKIITLALSLIVLLFPCHALAISTIDQHSIQYDTVFYDPTDTCASGNLGDSDGSGPLYGPFFPEVSDIRTLEITIKKYMQNTAPSSPLIALSNDIVTLGQRYNVSPAMLVAQAQAETSLATNGDIVKQYNPFGITGSGPGGFAAYDSFSDSIKAYYKLLSGPLYLGPPANLKTIAQLEAVYNPGGGSTYVKFINSVIHKIMENLDTSGTSGGGTGPTTPLTGSQVLKGHHIPASSGTAGVEGHLSVLGSKGDGGSLQKHYALTNVPAALRLGWSGNGAATSGALGTNDPVEEQYYMNMRWLYASPGHESSDWYLNHPRILVTNTKNNRQMIAAAVDWGPASYTGHVAGLSYESRAYLQYDPSTRLEFAWAPDQNATPGPVGKDDQQTTKSNDPCNTQNANNNGPGNTAGPNGWDLKGAHAMISYEQTDPKWANKPYGNCSGATIASSGCGPTSAAMVVATLTNDSHITPLTIAQRFGQYHVCGSGSSYALFPAVAKAYNLKEQDLGMNLDAAARTIRSGGLVIILVRGYFTSSGHFMVLRAITSDGNGFYISDPNSTTDEARSYSKQFLITQGGMAGLWGFSR